MDSASMNQIQTCIWCHYRLREMGSGCPKCRREFLPEMTSNRVDDDEMSTGSSNAGDTGSSRSSCATGGMSLRDVRVVRRDLCYIVGLPLELVADLEALKGFDYLGKYGCVMNIIVNKNPNFKAPDKKKSCAIYVTYRNPEEAQSAILDLNDAYYGGRSLRASYGTTKYCSSFLKNVKCGNRTCFYLHERGADCDTFTIAQMARVKESGKGLTCSKLLTQEFKIAQAWKDPEFTLFGKNVDDTLNYFTLDPKGKLRPPLPYCSMEIMKARANLTDKNITDAPIIEELTFEQYYSGIYLPPPPRISPKLAGIHPTIFSADGIISRQFLDDDNEDFYFHHHRNVNKEENERRLMDLRDLTIDEYSEVIKKVQIPPNSPSSYLEAYITPADQRSICRNPKIIHQNHPPGFKNRDSIRDDSNSEYFIY